MVAPKSCTSTPTAAAAAAPAPSMDCAPRLAELQAAPTTRRTSSRVVTAVSEFPQPGSPMVGTKRGRAAALATENPLLSHSEDDDDDSDSDSGHDGRGMVGLEKMSMEERRRAIRRMKNRESARRVRARRIQQVGDLTTQVQAVAGENKDLKAGMALLRNQLHAIQAQLQEAATKCEALNNENLQLATELQALRGTAAGSNSNSGTKKGSVLGCGPSPPPVTSGAPPALAPIRTASPFTAGASSALAQSPCGPSLRRNCSSLLHRQATIKAEQEAGNHLQPLGPSGGPAIALLADEPRGSLCTQDSTVTGDCKLWGAVQQSAGPATVQGQQSINSSQLQLLLQGPGTTLPCAPPQPSQQLLRPAQQDRCLFQGALQLGDTSATDAMLQAALGCDNLHLLQPFLPPLDSFWYEGLGSSLQILPSDLDFMLAPDFALQSASSKYAASAGHHNVNNAVDTNVVGTVPPVDLAAPCTNTSASDDDSSQPHTNQWSP